MKAIILMDVNILPSEYKSGDLKSNILKYEKDFDVKIIPYDNSKKNIEGAISNVPIIVGKIYMSFENILKDIKNLKGYILSLDNVGEGIDIIKKLGEIERKLEV